MPELDSKDVTFHFRGIPTTQEELGERDTSNRDLEIFSPQRFGIQVQSKAFD
jgi:hypothetical protein